MQHGDFTELAKFYVDRPGYSMTLLSYIKNNLVVNLQRELTVADVGAGTGKLTECLENMGLSGMAVEPNDAMREEGIKAFADRETFIWSRGTAEETGLENDSVDWLLMGSSFHWADAEKASKEFKRVLKRGGAFTAIWNPRDIKRSKLHMEIEDMINKEIPYMKRVSSGRMVTTELMQEKLGGGIFSNLIYMECEHEEVMTKERYMNIWRSVNDIRVQAGEDRFERILHKIENIIKSEEQIVVPYKSRAWTAVVNK